MGRIEKLSQIHQLAKTLPEEDIKELISSLQSKVYQAEDKYDNIEEIDNLAIEIGIRARECFTYLVNTGEITKEQIKAFENLASCCEEFSRVFNYYKKQF
jgi:hypothetical protein